MASPRGSQNVLGRPGSAGPTASNQSSASLAPLNLPPLKQPLPQEWLLPHEHKIEKREPYENWKLDVQSQLLNLKTRLSASLDRHPAGLSPTSGPTLEHRTGPPSRSTYEAAAQAAAADASSRAAFFEAADLVRDWRDYHWRPTSSRVHAGLGPRYF